MSELQDPTDPEQYKASGTTPDEAVADLEADLRFLHYQKPVVDAAVLEGVDITVFAAFTQTHPDPTLQHTIHLLDSVVESAKMRAMRADIDDETAADSQQFANGIDRWTYERNLAFAVQQIAWARMHLDEHGVDPTEAKVSAQLEMYTLKGFTPDQRLLWLRVVDRVFPEVPGLDPADPQTAIAIEEWS